MRLLPRRAEARPERPHSARPVTAATEDALAKAREKREVRNWKRLHYWQGRRAR